MRQSALVREASAPTLQFIPTARRFLSQAVSSNLSPVPPIIGAQRVVGSLARSQSPPLPATAAALELQRKEVWSGQDHSHFRREVWRYVRPRSSFGGAPARANVLGPRPRSTSPVARQ